MAQAYGPPKLMSTKPASAGGNFGDPLWDQKHPRREWFEVRQLEAGVHLISEPGHVNSFLIQG